MPSPITPEGYERLQEELKRLKNEERPAIGRALEEARKALGLAPASEAPKRMEAGAIEGLLVHPALPPALPAPRAPPRCAMLRRAG